MVKYVPILYLVRSARLEILPALLACGEVGFPAALDDRCASKVTFQNFLRLSMRVPTQYNSRQNSFDLPWSVGYADRKITQATPCCDYIERSMLPPS